MKKLLTILSTLFTLSSFGQASVTLSAGVDSTLIKAQAKRSVSLVFTTTGSSGAATGTYNDGTGVFTFNVPQYSGGTVTPAALTKTDDTNVTLTLGGTPTTALLQATSLTLGWTGTLADGRIASASTWNAKQNALTAGVDYLTPTGSAAGLTSFPTLNQNTTGNAATATNVAWSGVTSTPTTLAGYSITDALSTTLADGKINVGNGSNIATAVTPSGDVTITNAGVTAIGSAKVTNAMLAGSISNANLANSSTTINGTSIALGASGTVTAAAGTLTGTTLASGVTASSLTSFGSTPTLVTPILGVATATSINKVTITAPATSATLTIADGKTLTSNNSISLTGTDATVMTFPTTSATIARTDAAQTFSSGTQTFTAITTHNGGLSTNSTTTSGNFFAGSLGTSNSSVGKMLFAGASGLGYRAQIGGGATTTTQTVGNSHASLIVVGSATEAASGTSPHATTLLVQPLDYTNGAGATDTVSTVNIPGVGSVGTNKYALLVSSGTTRLQGDLQTSGSIGVGAVPNASALVDLTSTTKALKLMSMTKTQRDAISSPQAGYMIYQNDNTPGLRVYNGTNWMRYTETAD